MDDKLYAVLYLDESRMIIWSTYWNYSSFILGVADGREAYISWFQ